MINYQLLDFGEERKLEKFGRFIIDRPCEGAFNAKKLSPLEWYKADFFYDKKSSNWVSKDKLKDKFQVKLSEDLNTFVNLKLLAKGQIGIFPEHVLTWDKISLDLKSKSEVKVLNGFAYSGILNLYALKFASGVQITHLDSQKSIINLAKENLILNGFTENKIRWIVDDALSFIQREAKRKAKYEMIILDPPTFGKGIKGKTWSIKRDLFTLIELTKEILAEDFISFYLSFHDFKVDINKVEIFLRNLFPKRRVVRYPLNLRSFKNEELRLGIAFKIF